MKSKDRQCVGTSCASPMHHFCVKPIFPQISFCNTGDSQGKTSLGATMDMQCSSYSVVCSFPGLLWCWVWWWHWCQMSLTQERKEKAQTPPSAQPKPNKKPESFYQRLYNSGGDGPQRPQGKSCPCFSVMIGIS